MTESQAEMFWKEWTLFIERWKFHSYVTTMETCVAQFSDGSQIAIDWPENGLSTGNLKNREHPIPGVPQ